MRRWRWLWILSVTAFVAPAHADVDFARALSALGAANAVAPLPSALLRPKSGRVALVLERVGEGAPPPGAVAIHDGWYTLDVEAADAARVVRESSAFRYHWSPSRRLLVDRANGWTRAERVRSATGLTGRGVVVGVVDSGVDVGHPDLRREDGTTRIAWLIDFSRPPRGVYPELEAEYGCGGASQCAVYTGADLDSLAVNGVAGDEPRDTFGHGTHVASLAVGNDRTGSRYSGVAPEADLVVARVSETGSGITDADVLRAARFVFDRARDASAPAVLNLSLGSDFGAHDGRSSLERALAGFVGPDEPGRAIVVAAGNSAGLFSDVAGFPGPLGTHTEVHVPRGSPARVPLLTIGGTTIIEANVYVWLGFRAGDRLEVGLDLDGEEWIAPVAPGSGTSETRVRLRATVLNGVSEVDAPLDGEEASAVIVLGGAWPSDARFDIRLRGHGTASVWVQGDGDLDPSVAPGALVPFAFKEGTVNVPASSPDLIAVGASLNRTDWVDATGALVTQAEHGSLEDAPLDTTAYFSSAGPNALGVMKPDIVAPGANVVGAMASAVDPRRSGGGLFGGAGRCSGDTECFVVDDAHAIASGTSMAAPLVTGAIALLFERDPSLTQPAVRALLQAGARPLEGVVFSEQQAGPGALDLEETLAAAIAEDSPIARIPSDRSWIALAAPFARPDPEWPLRAVVELRDAAGDLADGFDPRRLTLSARGATVVTPLTRLAPGLHEFAVAAASDTGGGSIELALRFDGEPFVERRVPIAVDRGASTDLVTVRGGCGFAPRPAGGSLLVLLVAAAAFAARFRPKTI